MADRDPVVRTEPGSAEAGAATVHVRAGVLAHDLNNVLTTILGYANLLGRSLDEADPRRRDVEEIVTAAGRLSELVGHVERLGRASAAGASDPDRAAPEAAGRTATSSARASVLVVDDERPVRYLVRTILERAGYAVSEAATAAEAEAHVAGASTPVDLVIADLSLPEASGIELVNGLRGAQPSLKALFISGYADPPLDGGTSGASSPFLQKPFTVEALTAAVQQALQP